MGCARGTHSAHLTEAGASIDGFMADALVEKLEYIERIDRLAAIAESRRNASLCEIERRRAVFGATLRRNVQEIEDAEFKEIETTPAKGKTTLDERPQDQGQPGECARQHRPRTARGRASAARNALRHGLTLPVCSDSALSEEIEALAREIAGPGVTAEIQELARRVAEAQIDLRRVRYARHQLLSNALSDPYYESRAAARAKLRLLPRLLRPNAPEISMETLTKFLTSTPQGPEKFATILSEEVKRILAMDRYERRALLRRKIAIQLFDEAEHYDCNWR